MLDHPSLEMKQEVQAFHATRHHNQILFSPIHRHTYGHVQMYNPNMKLNFMCTWIDLIRKSNPGYVGVPKIDVAN